MNTVTIVRKAKKKRSYVLCVGIDLSPSSIALCAKSYDPITDVFYDPVWIITRWYKDSIHWDKLKFLSRSELLIFDLQNKLKGGGVVKDLDSVYIGVEELPPYTRNANRYREQAELIGACVASLLRYGHPHVYSVPVPSWQAMVASDLNLTIKSPEFDKFAIKEWVKEVYEQEWPDLVRTSGKGLVPRPKTSIAKAIQPDDRVDATGIMEWVWSTKCPKQYLGKHG